MVLTSGVLCAFTAPLVGALLFAILVSVHDRSGTATVIRDTMFLLPFAFIPAGLAGAIAGMFGGLCLNAVSNHPLLKKYFFAIAAAAGGVLGAAFPVFAYVIGWD